MIHTFKQFIPGSVLYFNWFLVVYIKYLLSLFEHYRWKLIPQENNKAKWIAPRLQTKGH